MDLPSLSAVRVKRFRRSAAPRPMQLTDRDLHILAHVARHRFLSSAHLAALDGGSPQNLLRALRVLFDHGFLDRPAAQLASLPAEGPRPFVYGLGKKGAEVLHEHGHRINGGVDWTEKNKRAGAKFIAHTLEIAGFMTNLETACHAHDGVKLIREPEVISDSPVKTQKSREPLRWRVESVERGRREISTVVPDGLFGLEFPDETAAYFMLEIDRGTIPNTRTDREGTADWRKNIRYKFATYYEGWKTGRQVEQFGIKQLRVLVVTSSVRRVDNMRAVLHEITEGRGSNFFLFVDSQTLAGSDPLHVEWVTGKGERIRLTD